jgi:hypothetical protein
MRFRSMQVSVSTVTNIYSIPLYVPPTISNGAADYETKKFNNAKKSHENCHPANSVARLCFCRAIMLP